MTDCTICLCQWIGCDAKATHIHTNNGYCLEHYNQTDKKGETHAIAKTTTPEPDDRSIPKAERKSV